MKDFIKNLPAKAWRRIKRDRIFTLVGIIEAILSTIAMVLPLFLIFNYGEFDLVKKASLVKESSDGSIFGIISNITFYFVLTIIIIETYSFSLKDKFSINWRPIAILPAFTTISVLLNTRAYCFILLTIFISWGLHNLILHLIRKKSKWYELGLTEVKGCDRYLSLKEFKKDYNKGYWHRINVYPAAKYGVNYNIKHLSSTVAEGKLDDTAYTHVVIKR